MTILVPAIREPERLRKCLLSVIDVAHRDGVAVDVIIVLDAANEDVQRFVGREVDGATVLSWPEQRGFAAGLNAGFRAASTPFVNVLQDDTEVQPGWLSATLDTAKKRPQVGAIGPLVLFPDRTVQTAGAVIGGDGATTMPWIGDAPDAADFVEVSAVDYLSSSSILVRREAWAAVGGFDEELYPIQYVDADFCTALWNGGWQVVCDPRATIVHLRSGSSPTSLKSLVVMRNRARFMDKWGDFVNGRPLWATTWPTAAELERELRRARSWLVSPPAVALLANVGPPVESPLEVYVRRERDLLRSHVALLQSQIAEHDAAVTELGRVKQTFSWRLTTPLRRLRRWQRARG